MGRIVRIDEDVWHWLQALARPLEDTPNAVLRRVAGLGALSNQKITGRSRKRTHDAPTNRNVAGKRRTERQLGSVRITGEMLNKKYRLGARHALYHRDGSFYERLQEFPGVLCDPKGFVKYSTKEQFDLDGRLSIGEKVNIRQGLSSHPRYERFDWSKRDDPQAGQSK